MAKLVFFLLDAGVQTFAFAWIFNNLVATHFGLNQMPLVVAFAIVSMCDIAKVTAADIQKMGEMEIQWTSRCAKILIVLTILGFCWAMTMLPTNWRTI